MLYQWVFYDGSYGFHFVEGTDLYDVNKRAFEYYKEDLLCDHYDDPDYLNFLEDYFPEAYVRQTLFDFCLDKPQFVPYPSEPVVEITFHTVKIKED